MTLAGRVINAGIGWLVRLLINADTRELTRVPAHGPLIVVGNHINFAEVPILYIHLRPRRITGLAKSETWNNRALGYLFNQWGAIPLHRGEADVGSLRRGLAALEAGDILAIAPEGTRSGDGRLQRGHPGVVLVALQSQVPILPIAHYGGEKFWRNLKHLRRTDFHIAVGNPFCLTDNGEKVTRGVRQRMTDEIMCQIAALLPPAYRGHYADLSAATERYLHFPENSESNLRRAEPDLNATL